MKYFNYNAAQNFNLSLLFLAVLIVIPITNTNPQQRNEEERIGRIAREFYQQNIVQQNGSGGDSPEAIQQKLFTGQAQDDWFGCSVSIAGDVNGDGYSDIIVGAQQNDAGGNNAGRAYIYFGSINMDITPDVILTGAAAGDRFGSSVSKAGDVNSDGYDDVIVGAYLNDGAGTDAGRAYIYFGGITMDNSADLLLTGAAAGDNFGWSVSSAGDVNGDGYSDIIVGARGNDESGTDAGRAYIYLGGVNMNNTADISLNGAAIYNYFGYSVSSAGDINADGYADVLVGAPYNNTGGINRGQAYIFLGGVNMNDTVDVILIGVAAGDQFGWAVSSAGDVNGDGYADIVIGARLNDDGGTDAGSAYIYFGGANTDNIADVTLTGAAANDYFGFSVSTAGDINGDGYSDVIVGAYWNDAAGTDAGRAYIYFGGINMDNVADVIFTGAAANDYFGNSVSLAGDVNGDGYVDVIVGAFLNDAGAPNGGGAYLYTNSLSGTDIPDEFFTGAAAGDRFGYSVSTAGDVNGDGYADIVIGARLNDDGGTDAGSAYIYFGGANTDNIADVILTGAAANDNFGISVSLAGDVNSDGYSDVIVGAYNNDAGGSDAGRAYIYLGGVSMDNTADVILTGAAAGDYFGVSVSTAGDVNGDGYSDVIVGAYGNDAGGSNAGRAYIYYGSAIMDNTVEVILNGVAAGDLFGCSVSTAGDVNGDGYSDVMVGAPNNDDGGVNAGRAYIYFGSVSMNNTADVILTGAAANDNFGISVSLAGDVNSDGYSDVIVGAIFNDDGGLDAGSAYIYFGSVSMNNTADVILTGAAANDNFGISVSLAGDVNSDGYSDVIVGAYGNAAGGVDAGRSYIYFGGVSMNSTANIILTGAAAYDNFGISVSTVGDVNGDGYSDVIVGAHHNDAGGTDAGRAYLYLSSAPPIKPTLFYVEDVPDDQGYKLAIKFARSGFDIKGINKITSYKILRSYPPSSIGFSWEVVGTVAPIKIPYYTFTDNTPNNSSTFFYRILAQTSNPDEYWFSGILSGKSTDNLAPALVKNFSGTIQGVNNKLTWKANTEPDLRNYHLYRAATPTINPDTTIAFIVTTDTTGLDISVPPGDMYYFIRARDIHDNFGPLASITTPLPLRQINFTALIEGFYDSGSNVMAEDTVEVVLKNTTAPYTTIDQGKVKLNTNGNGLMKFRQAANNTNYYLVIKHRNAIETWSKLGQQFTNSEMIYDFTTAANKAYGDNMKLKGSKWCIYSGEIANNDEFIDGDDVALAFNSQGISGYVIQDVTGDDFVDGDDVALVFNNQGIGTINPVVALTAKVLRNAGEVK